MADTNFVNYQTPVLADWLNDTNKITYGLNSTAPGKGAALVGIQDAKGLLGSTTVEAALAELASQPVFFVNAQTGADPTGATVSTAAFQAAIDAATLLTNGARVVARGTYLVDTIFLKNNVTLDLTGARLNFVPHTTSHNPVIRIGTDTYAVSNAKVIGGEIDGKVANQTFASEQWSPGIFIWGSDDNQVIGTRIHDCRGDNITIGYEPERVVGSNRNLISQCELYAPNALPGRMCVAITYGNENRILYNRCSGVIDLELNASIGECKNNLVHGNSGRAQTESLITARTSDLTISLASLNTDTYRYFGNVVTANHCNFISMQYNKSTTISDNVVVGSVSTQNRLIDIGGCDDTIISGNQLDVNFTVASAVTDVIRTRGCQRLIVTGNLCRGDASTRPFHFFVNGFALTVAADHIFSNNQTETGWYRNGACQQPTETARFRINQDPAGSATATQISGVKCNIVLSRSGSTLIVSQVGNCGPQYLIQLDPQCNATTLNATSMTHGAAYTYTLSGSNRTLTVLTFAPAAGAVTLATFSFAAAGNTGTFFIDVVF